MRRLQVCSETRLNSVRKPRMLENIQPDDGEEMKQETKAYVNYGRSDSILSGSWIRLEYR